MTIEKFEITVNLVCRDMPGLTFAGYRDVHLGIQKGKETVASVPGDVEQAVFSAPLRVQDRDGRPNFLGPFVHGTPQQRFLYLVWVAEDGDKPKMFRRAKIHLRHLTWSQLRSAFDEGRPITATLRMTDAKGGPLCASVPASHIAWSA